MHKRDGPKLPYQAVVTRQSAMLMKGRNAIGREGGADPHTSLGPIPVLLGLRCVNSQSSKYRGQQFANGKAAAMTLGLLL